VQIPLLTLNFQLFVVGCLCVCFEILSEKTSKESSSDSTEVVARCYWSQIFALCIQMVVGWIPTGKISAGPVDVKDLLNEGRLGMFGDRYSHLMQELQVILWCKFCFCEHCSSF